MAAPKFGRSAQGKEMHYSVGALIEKNGKYLLIDRINPPFGFAGIAGHIDEGENPEQALLREVEEESGLKVEGYKLLFEEELDWNWCSKDIGIHHWYLFACDVSGETKRDYSEAKSMDWYHPHEIKQLKLEPVWEYWFKKLKLL